MKFKELGILIDKHAYSESSLILHFYTLKEGFGAFIFKGALKKRKAINQLGLYEFSHFKRPESDLGIIDQLDFAWTPKALYEKPQKVLLVFFMTDVLKQTLRHQGADEKLFYFLRNQLIDLETTTTEKLFPTLFLAQYLKHLGYTPLIEDNSAEFFDYQRGTFCHPSQVGASSVNDRDLITFIKAQFWPQSEKTSWPTSVYKEGLNILNLYAQHHIAGFNLNKTLEILHDTLYD